ncbi:hypothetical protein IAD21_00664 [Abditibacteriota bacterium]|nr:hypothetical protein IAD21_00664 [Abditibacteriota bacterium]
MKTQLKSGGALFGVLMLTVLGVFHAAHGDTTSSVEF